MQSVVSYRREREDRALWTMESTTKASKIFTIYFPPLNLPRLVINILFFFFSFFDVQIAWNMVELAKYAVIVYYTWVMSVCFGGFFFFLPVIELAGQFLSFSRRGGEEIYELHCM